MERILAKRITPADVEGEIRSEEYLFPDGKVTTICVLTLMNGRQVAGIVHGQSFDEEIGKREARKKAVAEIWPLLVFHVHQVDLEADHK